MCARRPYPGDDVSIKQAQKGLLLGLTNTRRVDRPNGCALWG